jgi:hypothetical protein
LYLLVPVTDIAPDQHAAAAAAGMSDGRLQPLPCLLLVAPREIAPDQHAAAAATEMLTEWRA